MRLAVVKEHATLRGQIRSQVGLICRSASTDRRSLTGGRTFRRPHLPTDGQYQGDKASLRR